MLKRILLVLAGLILLIVVFLFLLEIFTAGHPPSKRTVCRHHMLNLGNYVLLYADKTGRLPNSSRWVKEVRDWLPDDSTREWYARMLKCPEDRSNSETSYEMNPDLSGRRLAEFENIPTSQYVQTVLLREKQFPGSHGWIVYLDGHAERLVKSTD